MTVPIDLHDDGDRQAASLVPPAAAAAAAAPRLSLHRLVTRDPRERVLVHPLIWTDRQLAVLDCRVRPRGDADDDDGGDAAAPESGGGGERARKRRRAADELAPLLRRRLRCRLGWDLLRDTVRMLLESVSSAVAMDPGQEAYLRYARRPRVAVPYCRASFGGVGFACFDADMAARHRRAYTPWKWRRTTPEEEKEEEEGKGGGADRPADTGLLFPLLVALVIALAQQERLDAAAQAREPPPSGFTVRILFAGRDTAMPFNVVSARVRPAFLDKLDFPTREPAPDSGLDVEYWQVPAKPYKTLAHRLARRLEAGAVPYDTEQGRTP
ncbi:uncharacterized protein P884DRAFT_273000 [Thermothelomyces heterothallicus CBS 202.75]|uniref:uncharacterized protein n=1 Tax=Thermothelomyces heterothallicus CBS 202.75 TaxID=1149848 RepID=UPI0037441963